MTDLKTTFAGLSLRNPIIISSSGLTNSAGKNKKLAEDGAGAIVLKSLFEEQIMLEADQLKDPAFYPEASDYLEEYIREHKLSEYLTLIKESKKVCPIPIIASINCYRADTWIEFAKQLQDAGADAIELNVFFLETDIHHSCEDLYQLYTQILKKVKQVVTIPVIIKLGKYISNMPALVNQLKANGADGVVLFNRFYQPDIDLNTMQLVSGNVFSSHSDLSDTIRWTAIVSGKIPNISIASSTGVHDWEDVVKCLLAGASAVEMCSAIYTHGAEIISQITTCVEEWMHQAHYESLDQFIGKLNYANIPDPALYERSQFMKYFSNRD